MQKRFSQAQPAGWLIGVERRETPGRGFSVELKVREGGVSSPRVRWGSVEEGCLPAFPTAPVV